MVYQPPVGARDLLPLDVTQKHWIEDRLQQVFHRWGYHRIITSTLERLDTLMAGGAIQRSTVLQLQEAEEESLGLRPELTASIARAAVTRMAGVSYPQRLYYNANVFRRPEPGSHSRQQEFYQAGVELLGAGGFVADAEILLLLIDCLKAVGLTGWSLILGEAGLAQSLLRPFPEQLRTPVRQAIAHLDRIALETMSLPDPLRERALFLLDLRGQPADVLQQVSSLDLDPEQREQVNNLKSLVELLHESLGLTSESVQSSPLVLDLSCLHTFDYYTGIVFEVVSDRSSLGQQVLGQGGRYDQLLGLYHPQKQDIPGIGFSFNLEELHQVLLLGEQLPQRTPTPDWLVSPETPQGYAAAFTYAQTLRENDPSVGVEVDLLPRQSADAVRDYARRRRIAQIAWIPVSGSPKIESVN